MKYAKVTQELYPTTEDSLKTTMKAQFQKIEDTNSLLGSLQKRVVKQQCVRKKTE